MRAGKIPADGRLIEAVSLEVDEAALTGESVSVEKQTTALLEGEPAVADRSNMVYSGTIVTYGRGQAVVVATGMATEFGRIADSLQAVTSPRTPLQQSLEKVAVLPAPPYLMNDEELAGRVGKISAYARVSPVHKLRIGSVFHFLKSFPRLKSR